MPSGSQLPRLIVRYRAAIAFFWVVVACFLVPFAPSVGDRLEASASHANDREAGIVERALVQQFAAPYASFAVLVVNGIPSPATPEGRAVLLRVIAAIDSAPGVKRALSYVSTPDSGFLSPNGTFIIAGLDRSGNPANALVPGMRLRSSRVGDELRARYPGITLAWTGDAPFNYDGRETSAADARAGERRVLPLTIVLLLIVFGTVTAALVPAIAGALAIGLSLGSAALIAPHFPLSILLQNIVTMLGLGIGVDYALLTVSRFREALADGADAEAAAEDAVRHAGRTVMISGLAVAIGFAALMAVPVGDLRSIGVGGLLTVTWSALLATTLLPGLLAWLGPWINRGRVRPVMSADRSAVSKRWRQWGAWVASHPWRVLVVGGLPMLALASQGGRLADHLPTGEDWLPKTMEAAQAIRGMREMGKIGIVENTRVVLDFPPGIYALSDSGWQATRRLADRLKADPRVAHVRCLPMAIRADHPSPTLLGYVPADVIHSFMSRDQRHAAIEVIPTETATPRQLNDFVHDVRAWDLPAITGLPGSRLRIGGLPAQNTDYTDAVAGHTPLVVLLVIGGTFIALLVGFRSLLIPIKAIVLNLLSVAAAFGATVLVFQDGHGLSLVGMTQPVDGLFPAVPIIVFCLVFGLSMDYEVFLVARVAEAHRAGVGMVDALAEGVARTGGVITSAAAVMIVVFASFAFGEFLLIKVLGFALAVAVFLDATIVRLAVGPAFLRLAGRWNWWPGDNWRIRTASAPVPHDAIPEPEGQGAD
jgi:putative drug exporter of the RND superfamily